MGSDGMMAFLAEGVAPRSKARFSGSSSITDHLVSLQTFLQFYEPQILVRECSLSPGSQALFQALGIPRPDLHLEGTSLPRVRQTRDGPVQYHAVLLGSAVKRGLARLVVSGDHW